MDGGGGAGDEGDGADDEDEDAGDEDDGAGGGEAGVEAGVPLDPFKRKPWYSSKASLAILDAPKSTEKRPLPL